MTRHHSLLMTGLVAVMVILATGLAGCTSQAPSATLAATTPAAPVTTAASPEETPAAQPSAAAPAAATTAAVTGSPEYFLQPAEIPGNFTLAENRERVASELSQWARDHGWTKGYAAVYRKNDPASATVITQNISVYSRENATLAVTDTIDGMADVIAKENNANLSVEKLTIAPIGDASGSLKCSDKSDNSVLYVISFAKAGVFEDIEVTGTEADYESLKQLATAAAAKIP